MSGAPQGGKPQGSLRAQLSATLSGLSGRAHGGDGGGGSEWSRNSALRAALQPQPSSGVTFASRAAIDPTDPEASLQLFRRLRSGSGSGALATAPASRPASAQPPSGHDQQQQQQGSPNAPPGAGSKPAETVLADLGLAGQVAALAAQRSATRHEQQQLQQAPKPAAFSGDSARHSEAEATAPASPCSPRATADEGPQGEAPQAATAPAGEANAGSDDSPFAAVAAAGRPESLRCGAGWQRPTDGAAGSGVSCPCRCFAVAHVAWVQLRPCLSPTPAWPAAQRRWRGTAPPLALRGGTSAAPARLAPLSHGPASWQRPSRCRRCAGCLVGEWGLRDACEPSRAASLPALCSSAATRQVAPTTTHNPTDGG